MTRIPDSGPDQPQSVELALFPGTYIVDWYEPGRNSATGRAGIVPAPYDLPGVSDD
jgi:hypothetical protein